MDIPAFDADYTSSTPANLFVDLLLVICTVIDSIDLPNLPLLRSSPPILLPQPQHDIHMRPRQPLPLLRSQQLHRLKHIHNLAPIELPHRQSIDLLVGKRRGVFVGAREEGGPQHAVGVEVQLVVLEEEVDAGFERGVDVVDAVGRQEEDALVILQEPQISASEPHQRDST